MGRRSRKLPIASAGSEPIVSLSEADWQRIESKYENQLPECVRKAVLGATQKFVEFEIFERTAERADKAEAIINECKEAAGNFQHAMRAGGSSDAARYAKYLIKKNFHDTRLNNTTELFHTLPGLLTSFVVACTSALKELHDPSLSSFEKGEEWGLWVRRLTKIMKENSLPSGVRKDSDTSAAVSPFVAFVRELQKCLPAECKRHTHSDSALAQAISRARGFGTNNPAN